MYTAYDRLNPNASPGQLHVRRLAEESDTVDELYDLLERDRALLSGDRVLRRPDTLTVCERTYLEWQTVRGRFAQESGPLQERHSAYVVRRGEEPAGGTLAVLLAPPGDEPPLATKVLFSLFHDGPDPTVMGAKRLGGRLYPDEGVVSCDGGSQRVAAHVVGGVLLTPELGGGWAVVRTQPDRPLLDALRMFSEVVDPEGELLPQATDDVEAVRNQLVGMTGQLDDLYMRHIRMPDSVREWLYHRPLDATLERLSDEIRQHVRRVRRASRPRRLSLGRR